MSSSDALATTRVEQYDSGEVLYLAIDPDGVWAKSAFPDDLVTIDYNEEGDIIGVEVIGDLARGAREGLVDALKAAAISPNVAEVLEAMAR